MRKNSRRSLVWIVFGLAMALLPSLLAAQEYRLGTGDVLEVVVFGDVDLTRTVTVRADGMVSLPLVGDIQAADQTVVQLAEKIASALRPYLKDPRVTVTVSQARTLKVYLVGEVKSPGVYDMRPGWTVVEAITQAGGLTTKANLKKALLIRRTTGANIPLDLDRLILKADQSANVALEDGDIIQVPEFLNRVLVLGHVQNPGAFDLKEGGRVLDAILAAGGPDDKAGLEKVGVIRHVNGQAVLTTVDVARVQRGDLTGNVPVQNADIVYVPQTGRVKWADLIKWILDLTIVNSFLSLF